MLHDIRDIKTNIEETKLFILDYEVGVVCYDIDLSNF